MNILVVDDSSSMRRIIISALSSIGLSGFKEAGNVPDAMREILKEEFDLIIVDINMPGLSGLKLVSFIKGHPTYKDTPVLIVSSEASEDDMRKGMSLGANKYLCKPFAHGDLQIMVREILA